MTTDLLTVGPDERLDLAAMVMDQRRIRQLLVVDDADRFLGLVSYRALLRLLAEQAEAVDDDVSVRAFMDADPPTVGPGTSLRHAIELMIEERVSALPVVEDGKAVGILSEHDIFRVTGNLLQRSGDTDGGS